MTSEHYSLETIKLLMKPLGIKQSDLAKWLGITRQSMNQLLKGAITCTKSRLLAMTYVLDKYMAENGIIFDPDKNQLIIPLKKNAEEEQL